MGTKYVYYLMAFDKSVLSICQQIVLSKTFVPFEQFDLDIILKVTEAIYILNLADLYCGTNSLQASNKAVLGVLLFASIGSTNMGLPRLL